MFCGGSNLQFPIITKITHFVKKLSQSNCIIGSASINAEFHINTKILKNLMMSTKGTFMQGLSLLFGLVNSDKMSMYHDDSCIVIGREVMIISDMVHWTK